MRIKKWVHSGSYIGYSFAVPSNIARKVVEDIIEYGNVQNGILGVRGSELNSKRAEQFGVNETEGFYVDSVEEESGAFKAGLIKGDIIKELDGVKISKFTDLKGFLNTKSPKDIVYVTLLRNGKLKSLPVTLAKNETVLFPTIGVLKNASKSELKKYDSEYGVKISEVSERNKDYWYENGVKEGTIITAINGVKIKSIEDVERATNDNINNQLSIELINEKGEKERYRFK